MNYLQKKGPLHRKENKAQKICYLQSYKQIPLSKKLGMEGKYIRVGFLFDFVVVSLCF